MRIDNPSSFNTSSIANAPSTGSTSKTKVSNAQTLSVQSFETLAAGAAPRQLSTIQQVLSEFRNISAAIGSMSQSAQQQIASDKANGVGTFEGARQFSGAVLSELGKFSSAKNAAGLVGTAAGAGGAAASGLGTAASFASGLGGTIVSRYKDQVFVDESNKESITPPL